MSEVSPAVPKLHPRGASIAPIYKSLDCCCHEQFPFPSHIFLAKHINLLTFIHIAKMPYPETAEGFMIHDTKKWSTFKKEEVCPLM